MSYFRLEEPRIISKEDTARVCVEAIFPKEVGKKVILWYELDSVYKDYLYKDRVDMFLVAILPYCMEKGYDIQISCKTRVSADLLYQLREMMIPALKNAEPFHEIRIEAVPTYEKLRQGEGIATGVSGGVDSFYTILKNIDGLFPLTHLTLFNVQGYGEHGGDAARNNFQRNINQAKRICAELNREYDISLKLVTVDSNIQEMIPVSISYGGTYRDAGAILLLKQLLKIYYFAADTTLETFRVQAAGRFFSPWVYYCISTEQYRIQLYGTDADRIDKVKYLSKSPVTYDNL